MGIIKNDDLFSVESAMYVCGCIMRKPSLLLETDKYILTVRDFPHRIFKIIFSCLYNMAHEGVTEIDPVSFITYLQRSEVQFEVFKSGNGEMLLNMIFENAATWNESNFEANYMWLKKLSTLRDLQESGFSISDFIKDDALSRAESLEILNHTTIPEIIQKVKNKLQIVENNNYKSQEVTGSAAAIGIRDLLEELNSTPEVGIPLEGSIFNYATRGCRKGKMYMYSAPSGFGKTRCMVGNACPIAFPRIEGNEVVSRPDLSKVLFIATEMQKDEIQTLILSWISGVNEEHILLNTCTAEERRLLKIAVNIMEKYQNNFIVEIVTDPGVAKLKRMITNYIIEQDVQYIFYDYIFTSPSLMAEFPSVREDVALMMLSNTLKELAAEYNVFIMTGSQLNGDWAKTTVRNANLLRGAKALADKIDVGIIGVLATPEEVDNVRDAILAEHKRSPNVVMDIYKNRRGKMCNIKIFRYFDYGTCRSEDIIATYQDYSSLGALPELTYNVIREDIAVYDY
jgi:replicative DNA helicase